ncbi:hypothetical protein N7495_006889 [Penicillium taxi]|uniref:uncharacterized protein n=1 Tax=Penicillium taxi TaxID=168475 RepID=UPI00254558E5|nr:uncharacterized protein N7495_006889 [Penicillium taxi]KAJ5895198.1 hypothetical protein N7495_006889 [Penicillium taxi]
MTEAARVALLKPLVDPQSAYYSAHNVKNIRKIIELYENGQLTLDDHITVQDGEVVTPEEAEATRKPAVREAFNQTKQHQQLLVKASYDNGQLEVCSHEEFPSKLWSGY